MMIPASPWIALALLALLLPLAGRDPLRRAWALAALATLGLFLALAGLPALAPGPRWLGTEHDWSGPLLGLAGACAVTVVLVRKGLLAWRDIGMTWAQAPGSLPVAITVSALALAANQAVMSLSSWRLDGVSPETWLYQATWPGLVEETVFRGMLLAMAERAVGRPPSGRAPVKACFGWAGLLVTLAFVALHGIGAGTLTGVLPLALLCLWLRQRTGSLLLPIVAHNLWNLGVHAAHL